MPVNHSQLNLRALRDLGFTSDKDAHDFTPNECELTPQRLAASMSARIDESAPGALVRIVFNNETDNRAYCFALYLRMYKVQKLQEVIHGNARRFSTVPSWYFEAWVDQPWFDPATVTAVRCFADETGQLGVMQYINRP